MTYNSQQLAANAGITYRQLDHWIRQGYLKPEAAHPGQGRPREFSDAQFRHVALLAELVRTGFEVSAAARLAQQLETSPVVRLDGPSTNITVLYQRSESELSPQNTGHPTQTALLSTR